MRGRNVKRPKRTPRRKAGRSPSKAQSKTTFRLVVEAQEMIVSYKPATRGDEYAMASFEFRSSRRPARRIAISETGYYMHHAFAGDVKAAKSPKGYAREFVLDYLNRGRRPSHIELRGQLPLFS
jgi:hypothetical protein